MIYFDNAATSWPKPEIVRAAMRDVYGEAGGNPGRSGHRMSVAAARLVENAREAVAGLLHASDPSRIVFTHNATHALNLALLGHLHPGDHVVTSGVEHNSVMRPLRYLQTLGVEVAVVPCTTAGILDPDDVRQAIRPSTRLLVTTHASNVSGTLMPIGALTAVAHEHGIPYLVDASQTVGAVPIDVEEFGLDLLAFTGHKGLLGPTGTGGLYIREGVVLTPLIRGGTGSESAYEIQPEFLPDAYESGTMNVAGIAGLGAAAGFLSELGIDAVRLHERKLVEQFLAGASAISGVTVYGPKDAALQCGLVSFNVTGAACSEIGLILDDSFDIMVRTGLHCAPSAHRTFGTFPTGTVRVSFGWFNTSAEVDSALHALRKITGWVSSGKKSIQTWTA